MRVVVAPASDRRTCHNPVRPGLHWRRGSHQSRYNSTGGVFGRGPTRLDLTPKYIEESGQFIEVRRSQGAADFVPGSRRDLCWVSWTERRVGLDDGACRRQGPSSHLQYLEADTIEPSAIVGTAQARGDRPASRPRERARGEAARTALPAMSKRDQRSLLKRIPRWLCSYWRSDTKRFVTVVQNLWSVGAHHSAAIT